MTKTYKDWYLRGYEEGLREAWEEVSRMAARGHTSKEIQLYIRSRKASIHQSLKKKEVDFAKEVDSADAAPYSHARTAPSPQQSPYANQQQSQQPPSAGSNQGLELKNGYSYLVKEEKPDKSFALLSDLVSQGHKAICITRTHPAQVKDKYNIGDSRVIWLTKKEAGMSLPSGMGVPQNASEERISPSKLHEISSMVLRFLKENQEMGGVVLVDGLEYLVSHNDDFQRILKFIQHLNENVAENRGVLFVPVSSGFNSEWYSILRKELAAEVG